MQKGTIELKDGICALVDPEDHDRVAAKNWYAITRRSRGWVERVCSGTTNLHNFILGVETDRHIMVDHKNRNPLDNRKVNLRLCNQSQNMMNSRKLQRVRGTSSRYKGVTWDRQHGKWRAHIKKDGIKRYLGLYEDEDDAALAYNNAATVMFGKFARLNKVEMHSYGGSGLQTEGGKK